MYLVILLPMYITFCCFKFFSTQYFYDKTKVVFLTTTRVFISAIKLETHNSASILSILLNINYFRKVIKTSRFRYIKNVNNPILTNFSETNDLVFLTCHTAIQIKLRSSQ